MKVNTSYVCELCSKAWATASQAAECEANCKTLKEKELKQEQLRDKWFKEHSCPFKKGDLVRIKDRPYVITRVEDVTPSATALDWCVHSANLSQGWDYATSLKTINSTEILEFVDDLENLLKKLHWVGPTNLYLYTGTCDIVIYKKR